MFVRTASPVQELSRTGEEFHIALDATQESNGGWTFALLTDYGVKIVSYFGR